MSQVSELFIRHAKAKSYVFLCALECQVGAYSLHVKDGMEAVEDGTGLYWLYADWAEGSLGRFPAAAINKLAGQEVIPAAHYVGGA